MVSRRGERLEGDLIFSFIAWMGRAMPGLTFIISQNSNTWSKEDKGEMNCWEKREVVVREQGRKQGGGPGRRTRPGASWVPRPRWMCQ